MKTILSILGVASLATACARNDSGTASRSSEALVVVEGTNSAEFASALLTIADAEVVTDGQELSVEIDQAMADLAKPGAQLSLRVVVPEDAGVLDVNIRFDDFGGYEATDQAGEIDARGTSLRFQAPARSLVESGKAVVGLDVARSLAGARPERLVLLPSFAVEY